MRGLIKILVVIVVLADSFQGMRGWKNSTENQQLGHTPRSGPKVKNGRRGVKYGALRSSDAGQSKGRWVRSCRWCPHALQEEFSFNFIVHRYGRQKKAVTMTAKPSSQRARRGCCLPLEFFYPPTLDRLCPSGMRSPVHSEQDGDGTAASPWNLFAPTLDHFAPLALGSNY